MSFLGKLLDLGQKILSLQKRVEKNSEEIKSLRRDLAALTGFTRKVSAAVKQNRTEIEHDKEIREKENENLIVNLQKALLELELRLRTNEASDPRSTNAENASIGSGDRAREGELGIRSRPADPET